MPSSTLVMIAECYLLNAMPRMPSNLAATKARPGSDMASANVWPCTVMPPTCTQRGSVSTCRCVSVRVSTCQCVTLTVTSSSERKPDRLPEP